MTTDDIQSPISSSAEAVRYIAERLRLARKIRNVTLENMASSLGITRKQLQNYESAQSNINVARLWEISKLLDLETAFFVEGLGANKPLLNNKDLELIHKFNSIKDAQTKASILGIIQDL